MDHGIQIAPVATMGNDGDAALGGDIGRRPGRWTPRRLIYLLGGSLFLVSVVLFVLLIERQRQQIIVEARDLTAALAEMLSAHAGRLFDAADLVTNLGEQYASERSWDDLEHGERHHGVFRAVIARYEYLEAVWFLDASGMPRVTSRQFPPPTQPMADRDYFRNLRDSATPIYIGRLSEGRISGTDTLVFARRLVSPKQEFRGTVQVALSPGYFHTFYGSLDTAYPITIALLRQTDRSVLIAYPPATEAEAPQRVGAAAMRGTEGTIVSRSLVDRTRRIESYHQVQRAPIIVSVGIEVREVTSRWLRQVATQSVFAATALLGLLTVLGLAMQRLRHEEHAMAQLRGLAASLEQRVADRTSELASTNERLQHSLTHKDALLREVNHRVKNSLQLISSLLDLQGHASEDAQVAEQLMEASRRVHAVARVHQRLYSSDKIDTLEFGQYLKSLCADLSTSLASESVTAKVSVNAATAEIDVDTAIPLGLIISELVTGLAKAGHANGIDSMSVEFTRTAEKRVRVVIHCDAIAAFETMGASKAGRLSMRLVHALVDQLDGKLDIATDPSPTVVLTVPLS